MNEEEVIKVSGLDSLFRRVTTKSKKLNSKEDKSKQNKDTIRFLNHGLDPKHIIEVRNKFLRIEYPGIVTNFDKALETLGGIQSIESATTDNKQKLRLSFHPENKYNKAAFADKDLNSGILIKVNTTLNENNELNCEYEVLGKTVVNFTFNKICDFQYLPILPKNTEITETNDSEVEYIYDKIFPEKLPTVEWLKKKESIEQKPFFTPSHFSRFETTQNKLFFNTVEKYENSVRPDVAETVMGFSKRIRKKNLPAKQISIFINLQKENVVIPDQPLTYTMKLVETRHLQEQYRIVFQMFEERPIWTKVAVQYRTGIALEHTKVVLPAIGYFCNRGPWRMCWIKYGYNPQKEIGSKIYQTLDYRIRAIEGTKLKVSAKRNYASSNFHLEPNSVQKVSLNDKIEIEKKEALEESCYILRSTTIPPARQMFYQYCDILIPEIQEMLNRLPKVFPGARCDPKNGWLPQNFTEQCREVVNNYVLKMVQEQLLEDNKKMKEEVVAKSEVESPEKESLPTYCSKMLGNIKRGIYKSVYQQPSTSLTKVEFDSDEIDTIELLDEESDFEMGEMEQINASDVIASTIPERLEDYSDEENLSQASSDLDIDMEAVEEVNKMIAGMEMKVEENDVERYLKQL